MKPVPLRIFILGLLWAIFAAMLPVGVVLWRWVSLWQDPPDGRILGPLAVTCAASGIVGYWRKNKALFQLPPDLEAARELAGAVKRETTVQTVEHQEHPSATVITTVKETETLPPKEPQA